MKEQLLIWGQKVVTLLVWISIDMLPHAAHDCTKFTLSLALIKIFLVFANVDR